MRIPHARPADWPELDASRFAHSIERGSPAGCAVALLGLPYDGGVTLNRGRPGAAAGPAAFRAALARFADHDLASGRRPSEVRVFDAGDIEPASSGDHAGDPVRALHATHERVSEATGVLHDAGLVPVCIGGGHDLTFASVRGVAQHIGAPVGGVNVDAHMDVRPEVGSGMPFRALIEGGFLDPTGFVEFGIARFVTGAEQAAWALEQGVTIVGIEAAMHAEASVESVMERACGSSQSGSAFVSIDLDAIDGARAPGVSAVNPMGLSVEHVCRFAIEAGRRPNVRHFDIMELNPAHDVDGRTARVAGLLFMAFLAGFGERPR